MLPTDNTFFCSLCGCKPQELVNDVYSRYIAVPPLAGILILSSFLVYMALSQIEAEMWCIGTAFIVIIIIIVIIIKQPKG